MCVTSATADLYPVTTNVGVGQCAGAAGAGAEIRSSFLLHPTSPRSTKTTIHLFN